MKFYAPKYKQLDLGLLRSSLDEVGQDKPMGGSRRPSSMDRT
ncbi:hypothetical protein [Prevotella disiens]|nr:hypothetical protein [Prevotella disiens]